MFLSIEIGIDLGTANTRIFQRDKGIVIDEPSYIAIDRNLDQVIAVGAKAKSMVGRTPDNIEVIAPIALGVIDDIDMAEKMLSAFIRRGVQDMGPSDQLSAIVGTPSMITPVDQRAFKECCINAGVDNVIVMSEHILALYGLGIDPNDTDAVMLIDVGAGKTELSIFSNGGEVFAHNIRVGTNNMLDQIANKVKDRYKLIIGPETANRLLVNIGSCYLPHLKEKNRYYEVGGKNVLTAMPKIHEIAPEDVHVAINDVVREIIDAVKYSLKQCPPDVLLQLHNSGIVLSGEGGKLNGLSYVVSRYSGLVCEVGYEPGLAVVKGAGKQLSKLDQEKKSFIHLRRPKRRR